jgi:hypothetical protein
MKFILTILVIIFAPLLIVGLMITALFFSYLDFDTKGRIL